jgi:acetylornithine/succinyldiaminopimelate/putrescine aminotransferase
LKKKKILLSNALKTSRYIEQRLKKMKFSNSPNIRVKGLAVGITFKNKNYAKEIIDRCMKKGLLLAPSGTDFMILPSLDVDKNTLKTGLDILEKCL